MSTNKKLGFRDVVETHYYREIVQNDLNLDIINNEMDEGEEFSSWEDFLDQPEELISEILASCKDELDCEERDHDVAGYRSGNYSTDTITWSGDGDQSMYRAESI